jgi:hypothetical protein
MPPPRRPGRAYSIDGERRPLCAVCHAAAALDAAIRGSRDRLGASAPPPGRADHRLTMSHGNHAMLQCAGCHRFGREPRVHDRCRSCHASSPVDKRAPMSACAGCHVPASARTRGLGVAPSPYQTRATFSHGRHAGRVKAAGQEACLSCHPGLDELAGNVVPRPRKSSCAGCHDGQAAFSTTEARCRACHEHRQIPIGELTKTGSRFGHALHADVKCVACHPGGGRFDASVGHTLCATAGCHAAAFAERDARLCRTCHLGNEPWLAQHVDPPTRGLGDFGVRFDHRAHQSPAERSCQGCHIGDPDGASVGLSAGHAGCAGPNCHDATEPVMSGCDGCHALGTRARRQRTAAARRWSVRAAFRHRSHAATPDQKPVTCDRCHRPASRRGAPMPRPPKATCLGCHDGETAFKTTGHGCARCHVRAALKKATGSR